ncbi:reticulophagy regulator 3-like [Mytilus trossulus]|uniref:reticulophagy regulator 3-like n=1 Tax=Mytilus trossulus TaxID=6551 RepID=UPI003004E5EB
MDNPIIPNGDSLNRHSEQILKNILSPIEPFVMQIQSLLVWESPRRSAVLFIIIHAIFWFFTVFGGRIFFLISTGLIISYFIRTWKRKIWPEIRVPPKEPEDPDSWTPVHPRLLSVPEICKYLAQIWCSFAKVVNSCLSFRRNYRFLFCIVSCIFFISLAVLGHYIPGLMLSYITVISLMLWPCVLYHNLLQRFYLKFEPLFMKLDYSLKLKSKWSFKGKKSRTGDASLNSFDEDNGNTDTDSDDFCPSLDPEATAALARAITDSEDESNGSPSINTPMLSKEHSFSDDHDEDFTPDLGDLPSIGYLDDTDDEILETPLPKYKNSDNNPNGQDTMKFHPSHFGDSSEDEDETLTRDLKFPDIHEVQSPEPSQPVPQQQDAGMALIASTIVSQTFSSMMQSAMSGFNKMAATSSSGSKSSKVTYVKDESDVDIHSGDQLDSSPRRQSSDSDVDDIADEFEFLDQYDVEDTDKTQ